MVSKCYEIKVGLFLFLEVELRSVSVLTHDAAAPPLNSSHISPTSSFCPLSSPINNQEAMEDSGSVRARNTAQGDQDSSKTALGSTKPLHRFVQKEPKSLGVVLLMLGGAELLIGFIMAPAGDKFNISAYFYTPFWQGALFIVCGTMSIYTGIHPSKKMVTVCLSLYVVSLLGIIVSFGFRIWAMSLLDNRRYRHSGNPWTSKVAELLTTLEALLFFSSICVSGLLIFLCVVARLALKSTHTQIVLHRIQPPVTGTPTEEN